MSDASPPSAKRPRAARPTVRDADVPSDTVGLPGVGEGASAAQFARDTTPQQGSGGDEETHAPADPRDRDA